MSRIQEIDSTYALSDVALESEVHQKSEPATEVHLAAVGHLVKESLGTVAAAGDEYRELLDVLTKYGNNPEGIPALQYAIMQNDIKAVDILLKHGASPNTRDSSGNTCLHYAVLSGNIEMVKKFLTLGVNIDIESNFKTHQGTALHLAICKEKNEIAKFLVSRGARVNGGGWHNDAYESDAFEACCTTGNYEMLVFLIDRGYIFPNLTGKGNRAREGEWPLLTYLLLCETDDKSVLVRNNRIRCLKYLLLEGLTSLPSDPNSYFGVLANAYPESLEFLLKSNYITPNQACQHGKRPLNYVIWNQYYGVELVEILLKRGAEVNYDFWSGQTLMHSLCRWKSEDLTPEEYEKQKKLLVLLISYGGNLYLKDNSGKTPMDYAKETSPKLYNFLKML